MSDYSVLAWQTLLRPPMPDQPPPEVPQSPLKALTCRNAHTSLTALVTAPNPVKGAVLTLTDLASDSGMLPSSAFSIRLAGVVNTPEAGKVCDPLFEVEEFDIDRCAALVIGTHIPADTAPGIYTGEALLHVDGRRVAGSPVEIEVANVTLPDPHDWTFFLNVWMNPGAIARRAGVEPWSDEHFALLRPYIRDLAEHGQKTVVAPICHQPWGTQTFEPYPNLVRVTKQGETYRFDFSAFDRYVRLHEELGIDRAIHCYSMVQGPGETDSSVIEYFTPGNPQPQLLHTRVGEPDWETAWAAFLEAFADHLNEQGWMDKTYIAFDEKPDAVMEKLLDFIESRTPELRTALAGNTGDGFLSRLDDLCVQAAFDERGIADPAPADRSDLGVAQLLAAEDEGAFAGVSPDNLLTTFYVCCVPPYPNTFVHSPLVESRMLGFLAAQGGFDGFLRWSYNDWNEDPYTHPEFGNWPTGDTFFVYPGERGPVSSLRWEQLREGIQDYELARIASASIENPEQMVDYEQAIAMACRSVDGTTKAVGDIEIARRLLIPIAAEEE